MQLAKSILLYKHKLTVFCSFFFCCALLQAQDNSPYSRYGLGNNFPRTNVVNRAMGGISAAYTDVVSVNYNNPASYAAFQTFLEKRSNKVQQGRVVLDVGLNLSNRTLSQPNTTKSFTSSDALFSHVYVGIPIKRNWGLAFGLRPLTRISYDVFRGERLRDPNTNAPIDSVITQFIGTGGSFLPTIGTGFGTNNFSIGFNVGYLFGKKELTTRRVFINDSVQYEASNHTTNSSFGNLFFNAGTQYTIDLTKTSILRLGVSGNWKQSISGSQDILRQTYTRSSTGAELTIDTVFNQTDVKGEIMYPASYNLGAYYEKGATDRVRGFSVGIDYVTNQWDAYRFFGAKDLVQNSWELHVGAQLTPFYQATRFGQRTTYRFGLFTGNDYVKVDSKLPVYGVSFGAGLPIRTSRQSPSQYSIINLALEYSRRGNDTNVIKESLFRFSVGFNFTDLWFGKRKYD